MVAETRGQTRPVDSTGHYPRVWELDPKAGETKDILEHSQFWDVGEPSLRIIVSRVLGHTLGALHEVTPEEPEDSCWVYETQKYVSPIRRALAGMMGLELACWDTRFTDYYDPGHWESMRGYVWTVCREGHTKCVRPSHLQVVWKGGKPFP